MAKKEPKTDAERIEAWSKVESINEALDIFQANSAYVGSDPYYAEIDSALWAMLSRCAQLNKSQMAKEFFKRNAKLAPLQSTIGQLLVKLDEALGVEMHFRGNTPDWYVEAAFQSCYGHPSNVKSDESALGEPVAYAYELATHKNADGTYGGWRPYLTYSEPKVNSGSIRNLRKLYGVLA